MRFSLISACTFMRGDTVLWVYSHYKYFNSSKFWHIKMVPTLKGLNEICIRAFLRKKIEQVDFWKVRCLCCEPVMPEGPWTNIIFFFSILSTQRWDKTARHRGSALWGKPCVYYFIDLLKLLVLVMYIFWFRFCNATQKNTRCFDNGEKDC